MNINLSVIIERLKRHYHVRCSGDHHRSVTGIEIVRDSRSAEPLDRSQLHVMHLRSLAQLVDRSKDAPILCVVNPDTLTPGDEASFCVGVIIVVYAQSLSEVLLTLSQILYECGQQSSSLDELSKELLRCRTLDQALTVGYRWLKNPIIAADNYQCILSHIGNPFGSDGDQEEFFLNESIFPNRGSITAAMNAMELSMKASWPTSAADPDRQPLMTCKTMCSNGKVDGYLFVYYSEHPPRTEDDAILDILGNYCTVLLREQAALNSNPRKMQDSFGRLLQLLMDENGATRAQVEQYIDRANLHFKAYRYVLSVSPNESATYHRHPVHGIVDILSAAIPNTMGTYYRNSLILMIESDREILDFAGEWSTLDGLLKEYGFRAGISNVCRDIMDMKGLFFQAQRALTLGEQYFPELSLIPYYKCAPYHILELAATYHHPMDFCDPGVLQLQRMDKENNSSLLETLRIYLENGRNKTLTAQKLFLHPNSVKYRLNQISEVLNIEYNSFEDDLRLYQSLLLLRFCKDSI